MLKHSFPCPVWTGKTTSDKKNVANRCTVVVTASKKSGLVFQDHSDDFLVVVIIGYVFTFFQ